MPSRDLSGDPLDALGSEEVRNRAAGGAAVLGARGALVFVIGIVANVVLARLLTPRDFGVVALGSVLLVVGTYLTDGGMGATLIRRSRPPEHVELQAVAALQLIVSLFVAALGAAGAAAFGHSGLIVAVMLVSLPIASARLPAAIVLERRVMYRSIAFVDLVEAVTYYSWAIVAVALGAGVWGLASAVVVRALVGVTTMARIGPVGFVRPRWSWPIVRPVIGFGAKLQSTQLLATARDQALNIAVAGIAGVGALGVWSLAYRILQVPTLIINTAVRVSFPTMARMLEAGEDPRALIERGIGTLAVAIAAVLVALVGGIPAALPALLGGAWADAPAAILWSSLALLVSTPVVVSTLGYLYATNRAGTVVWAVAWQSAVWLAVTLALLPSVGAPAVGLGSVPAAVVLSTICGRKTARATGAAILRPLLPPVVIAVAAGAAGWAVAKSGPATILLALAGFATAEAVLIGGLRLGQRAALRDTYALLRRAVVQVRGSL